MSKSKKIAVIERDGLRCSYCGRKLSFHDLHLDHIYPRSLGGKSHIDNLVASCRKCNEMKGCMTVERFVEKQRTKLSALNIERRYLASIIRTYREKHGTT